MIYRCLETTFGLIPISLCYRLGQWIGTLSYYIASNRRASVLRNLTIAYADQLSQEEINQLAKDVFATNGGNLLSSVKSATMSKNAVQKCVTIEGGEILEQFAKENNGAILVLPHMGNWEVGARLNELTYGDRSSGAMYRPLNNPYIDNLVKRRREASGTQLFARKDSMPDALQLIRDGGILGILADQRAGKAGIITPFFGRLTSFAPLPDIYKRRTKCGIISLSIESVSPGHWKATYKAEATKETKLNTADIAGIIERLMNVSPADCFWMQDRWKLERKPLRLLGKLPIQQGLLSHSKIKVSLFAIYIETFQSEFTPTLQLLASSRPDLQLVIFSPQPFSAEGNWKLQDCPAIDDSSKFSSFIQRELNQQFYDLLLVPSNTPSSSLTNLSVQHYLYDPAAMESSLHSLGLPSEPII